MRDPSRAGDTSSTSGPAVTGGAGAASGSSTDGVTSAHVSRPQPRRSGPPASLKRGLHASAARVGGGDTFHGVDAVADGHDSILYPVSDPAKLAILNFEVARATGVLRPRVMYAFSPPDNPQPGSDHPLIKDFVISQEFERAEVVRKEHVATMAARTASMYIQLGRTHPASCMKAASRWNDALVCVEGIVGELTDVLTDVVFPNNKYTRRRADLRGSQLYLPGLIKAVITDFSYKRYFSSRTAGGRREYSVAVVMDVSQSMLGHLEDCAVTSLMTLLSALIQAGIEHVSLVLFGSSVRVIKTASMAWDPVAMLILLCNLHCDTAMGSCDATALHVALDLLGDAAARGPKKLFILSDGYSSCGLELVTALVRAEKEGVDVLALCVGMESSQVAKMYRKWMTVAVPSALPDAFRAFFEQDSLGVSPAAAVGEADDLLRMRLQSAGAAETLEEVFSQSWVKALPNIAVLLQEERELKLSDGGAGVGFMSLDLCFVLDCTGSMQPWLGSVKVCDYAPMYVRARAVSALIAHNNRHRAARRAHVRSSPLHPRQSNLVAICKDISVAVEAQFPEVTLAIRFSALGYRDKGDVDRIQFIDFRRRGAPASREAAFVENEADASRVASWVCQKCEGFLRVLPAVNLLVLFSTRVLFA